MQNSFWFRIFSLEYDTKGQLISKFLFGVIISTKIATKILDRFLPWNFCSFLGAFWKLLGLPGDLVSIITTKAAYIKLQKLPGSPQEATKIFRAEILTLFLIFVAILVVTMTPKTHFEINWPLIKTNKWQEPAFLILWIHLKCMWTRPFVFCMSMNEKEYKYRSSNYWINQFM